MLLKQNLSNWYFEGDGVGFYIGSADKVPLDVSQPQGDVQWACKVYDGTNEKGREAVITLFTGQGIDLCEDDVDVLLRIHDACQQYTDTFESWIQITYPGYDMYVQCENDVQREQVKQYYTWVVDTYAKARSVFGDHFESFLAVDKD